MQNIRGKVQNSSLIFYFALFNFICVFAVIIETTSEPVYAAMVIQSVAFRGNSVFSQQKLKEVVQSREGMEFDRNRFERDLEAIVSLYHKKGYRFARIKNPARRVFPNGVYLMIVIDEGIIGNINVYGNEYTKKEVIVRELLLEEGKVYNEEDRLESERILRRKQSLGKAEITAFRNKTTGKVDIKVEVTDLWTLFPSINLPIFNNKDPNISVAILDTNILGYGQKLRLRYEHGTNHESVNSISGSFVEPRLFGSHFLLHCDFAKKMGETPWSVSFVRPFYSLKTSWSMEFMMANQIDTLEWLFPQNGEVEEKVSRNQQIRYGRITHSFGKRKNQTRLSLWGLAQDKKFESPPVYAKYESGINNMIGMSISRAKVNFTKETFLNKLGRVEDIRLGYNYGISLGYALAPDFNLMAGSDGNEAKLMLYNIYSQKYGKRNFVDIKFHLQTHRIFGRQRDTMAAINARYFLKDILWQTFVIRFSGQLGDNLETRQLILDAKDGIRGYGDDRFVGTKIVLLNIEDRMFFFKRPFVVIGGVIFADTGWIMRKSGYTTKRSAGIGLRIGIPKLSGSPVYRLDMAYAFDDPREFSFARAFSFAMGHLF